MMTDAVGAAESSRKSASVVGFLGLLWSGLGLVGALQYAYNSVWQVNDRGMKDKLFGLSWLGGAAVLFVGGAAATTALRWLPGFPRPARHPDHVRREPRPVAVDVPGPAQHQAAVAGAAARAHCSAPSASRSSSSLGAYYVPKAVASSSQLYGSLGIVFAVLAWLLLFGRLVVYSAVLNVVRYEQHQGTIRAIVEAPPLPGVRPVANRSGRLVAAD